MIWRGKKCTKQHFSFTHTHKHQNTLNQSVCALALAHHIQLLKSVLGRAVPTTHCVYEFITFSIFISISLCGVRKWEKWGKIYVREFWIWCLFSLSLCSCYSVFILSSNHRCVEKIVLTKFVIKRREKKEKKETKENVRKIKRIYINCISTILNSVYVVWNGMNVVAASTQLNAQMGNSILAFIDLFCLAVQHVRKRNG